MLVTLTRQDRETAAAFASRRCLEVIVNKQDEDCDELWGGNHRTAAAEMAVSRGLKTLWLGGSHLHHKVDREFFLEVQCLACGVKFLEVFKPASGTVIVAVEYRSPFEFDVLGWISGYELVKMKLPLRFGTFTVARDFLAKIGTLLDNLRVNASLGSEE